MYKKALFLLMPCVLVGFGCRTGTWQDVNQLMPPESNPVASALKNSSICPGNEKRSPLSNSAATALGDSVKDTKVSKGSGICVVEAWSSYRTDQPADLPYNKRYIVQKKIEKNAAGDEVGGSDFIQENEQLTSDTSDYVVAVSAYSSNPLEPVGYAVYQACDSEVVAQDAHKKQEAEHSAELVANIVKKVKSQCATEVRPVKTFIPNKAVGAWREYAVSAEVMTSEKADELFVSQYGFTSPQELKDALTYLKVKDDPKSFKPTFAVKLAMVERVNLLADYYCYLVPARKPHFFDENAV